MATYWTPAPTCNQCGKPGIGIPLPTTGGEWIHENCIEATSLHSVTTTWTRWGTKAACTCGAKWRNVTYDGADGNVQIAAMFRHIRENDGQYAGAIDT